MIVFLAYLQFQLSNTMICKNKTYVNRTDILFLLVYDITRRITDSQYLKLNIQVSINAKYICILTSIYFLWKCNTSTRENNTTKNMKNMIYLPHKSYFCYSCVLLICSICFCAKYSWIFVILLQMKTFYISNEENKKRNLSMERMGSVKLMMSLKL